MLLLASPPPAQSFSYTPLVVAAMCAVGVWVAGRRSDREGAGCGCLSSLVVVFVAAGTGWGAGAGTTLFLVFALTSYAFGMRMRASGDLPGGGFAPSRFRRRPQAPPSMPPAPPPHGRVSYPDQECSACGAPYEPDDERCRYCGRARR